MGSRLNLLATIIFIALLLAFFGVYGFFKSENFIKGPQIILGAPEPNAIISHSYAEITGSVKNVSALYLNGRQIFTDKNGNFKEGLLLARGYNIIELSAKDKFGRETKEQREAVLK